MGKRSKKKKNKLHYASVRGSGRISISDEISASRNLGVDIILNSGLLSRKRRKLLKYRQDMIDQINTSRGENVLKVYSNKNEILKKFAVYIDRNESLLKARSRDQEIRSGINTIGIKITSPKIVVYTTSKNPREGIESDFRKVGISLAKAGLKVLAIEKE
jgi:hypothetical protein